MLKWTKITGTKIIFNGSLFQRVGSAAACGLLCLESAQ